MTKKVVVLDYGSGNVGSVMRAFKNLGVPVELTDDRQAVMNADGLVVPGVGAFETVMRQLGEVNAPFLVGRRIAGNRPVLGICVGLQVMFEEGIEHGVKTAGLGQWPGAVERLKAPIVPHMGWNTVEPSRETVLFQGVEQERFYFVHSYGVNRWSGRVTAPALPAPRVTWTDYGGRFVSAVENGALSATQFHPEKSGDAGMALLKNWTETL